MKKRVVGLDSIRFAMAIVVLLDHTRLLNFDDEFVKQFLYVGYWKGFINNIFPGKVAVIVFFVVSGFCIHYPYAAGNNKLNVLEFYVRRFLRIGIPAIIALLLFKPTQSVIWSVICEMFYYLLYPIVLYISGKKIYYFLAASLVLSYAISFNFSLTHDYNGDFDRVGYLADWLVGLPIWLFGVLLAQNYANEKSDHLVSYRKLLIIRFLVWSIGFVCSVLRFHANISYAFTMPVFGILVYYWLWNEILYYKNKSENKVLVYGGTISYSIYLIHSGICVMFMTHYGLKYLGDNFLVWVVGVLTSLLASWIFYELVEKQSHTLAKRIKI